MKFDHAISKKGWIIFLFPFLTFAALAEDSPLLIPLPCNEVLIKNNSLFKDTELKDLTKECAPLFETCGKRSGAAEEGFGYIQRLKKNLIQHVVKDRIGNLYRGYDSAFDLQTMKQTAQSFDANRLKQGLVREQSFADRIESAATAAVAAGNKKNYSGPCSERGACNLACGEGLQWSALEKKHTFFDGEEYVRDLDIVIPESHTSNKAAQGLKENSSITIAGFYINLATNLFSGFKSFDRSRLRNRFNGANSAKDLIPLNPTDEEFYALGVEELGTKEKPFPVINRTPDLSHPLYDEASGKIKGWPSFDLQKNSDSAQANCAKHEEIRVNSSYTDSAAGGKYLYIKDAGALLDVAYLKAETHRFSFDSLAWKDGTHFGPGSEDCEVTVSMDFKDATAISALHTGALAQAIWVKLQEVSDEIENGTLSVGKDCQLKPESGTSETSKSMDLVSGVLTQLRQGLTAAKSSQLCSKTFEQVKKNCTDGGGVSTQAECIASALIANISNAQYAKIAECEVYSRAHALFEKHFLEDEGKKWVRTLKNYAVLGCIRAGGNFIGDSDLNAPFKSTVFSEETDATSYIRGFTTKCFPYAYSIALRRYMNKVGIGPVTIQGLVNESYTIADNGKTVLEIKECKLKKEP